MPTTTEQAAQPAWVFALQHLPEMRRLSTKPRFRRHHVEPEEFVQELLVRVVERYELYDPTRGTPRQWLFMLAMWGTRDADRRNDRAQRTVSLDGFRESDDEPHVQLAAPPGTYGTAEIAVAKATVRQVLGVANSDQLKACSTVLDDLSGPEVQARLGISNAGRNYHLKRLRAALQE